LLFKQLHRFLNGTLELWIVSRDHGCRSILHFDVRRDALVLQSPTAVEIVKGE
jgi:hypothetical protein